jgi:hypothetical protein
MNDYLIMFAKIFLGDVLILSWFILVGVSATIAYFLQVAQRVAVVVAAKRVGKTLDLYFPPSPNAGSAPAPRTLFSAAICAVPYLACSMWLDNLALDRDLAGFLFWLPATALLYAAPVVAVCSLFTPLESDTWESILEIASMLWAFVSESLFLAVGIVSIFIGVALALESSYTAFPASTLVGASFIDAAAILTFFWANNNK